MKKIFGFIIVLALIGGILVFNYEYVNPNDAVDFGPSYLSFSPVGIWIDLSDGEAVFDIFENGTFDYGAEEFGKWTVVDENVINLVMGETDYDVTLTPNYLDSGYNVIGNKAVTLCFLEDYDRLVEIKAREDEIKEMAKREEAKREEEKNKGVYIMDYKIKNEDIKEILEWEGPDGCYATNRITIDGCKIGYMYREEPANEVDSGWRFFEGEEDDEYVDNVDNIGLYRLNTICNYDESIIPLLNSEYGSAYYRFDGEEFQKVKLPKFDAEE